MMGIKKFPQEKFWLEELIFNKLQNELNDGMALKNKEYAEQLASAIRKEIERVGVKYLAGLDAKLQAEIDAGRDTYITADLMSMKKGAKELMRRLGI